MANPYATVRLSNLGRSGCGGAGICGHRSICRHGALSPLSLVGNRLMKRFIMFLLVVAVATGGAAVLSQTEARRAPVWVLDKLGSVFGRVPDNSHLAGLHVLNRPGGTFRGKPGYAGPKIPQPIWRALEHAESDGRDDCRLGNNRVIGWLIVVDKNVTGE